jgi:hypothetical protein
MAKGGALRAYARFFGASMTHLASAPAVIEKMPILAINAGTVLSPETASVQKHKTRTNPSHMAFALPRREAGLFDSFLYRHNKISQVTYSAIK